MINKRTAIRSYRGKGGGKANTDNDWDYTHRRGETNKSSLDS